MRLLGIDYGTKRVGIALSDQSGRFAFPYQILDNNAGLAENIDLICTQEKVGKIIIGESKTYRGQPNPIMKKVLRLQKELVKFTQLPVELEPEFLTSVEAGRLQGEKQHLDDSAAALILKSYIDKHE